MSVLPNIASEEDYRTVFADREIWLPSVRLLCVRHGLEVGDLRRATLGSHVVFHTGEWILKLFFPLWQDDFVAERAALTRIKGLPIPELVTEGELEGWSYMVMSRVPGIPAVEIWEQLSEEQKVDIARQIGEMMRRLHEQPPVLELTTDWGRFLAERIDRVQVHHHLEEPWRRWIDARLAAFHPPPFTPVLLSADITEDHVLLGEQGGQWPITGFIDFGDAMMGHSYYDFIAPLGFYACGRPAISRALVEGYGMRLTAELTELLTTYCLLHEFARLQDFMARCPFADGPGFFRALWGEL